MRIAFRNRLRFVSILGGIWAAGLTSSASADEPVPPSPNGNSGSAGLEEIVVTATRHAQALQDVPMTVDVATGERLQKLNLFDFKDVQQLAPGLELTNLDGRSNSATLRGLSFNPDSGASPAVDVYFNEIPIDAQTAFTAIYDVAQIEVLRGPQGALRGRTAPAGAITLASRRPNLSEVEGYAQATGSDQDGTNLQAAVSLPIVKDKLAVRLSGLYDKNDLNELWNVSRNGSTGSRTESGRVSVGFNPIPEFNALLTYQYLHANNTQYQQVIGPGNQPSLLDPARSGPMAGLDDRIAVAEGPMQFQNFSRILTLSADWQLGNYTLSVNGGRQNAFLEQSRDLDPGNAVPGYQQQQLVFVPYYVTTGEVRLSTNGNGFWSYSFSALYLRQTGPTTVSQPADQFLANAVPATPFPASFGLRIPINVNILVPTEARTISPGFSTAFQFTKELRLELAARYNKYRNVQQSYLSVSSPGNALLGIPSFTQPSFGTVLPPNDRRENHSVTGGASLTYKVNDEVTTYLAYGRSYRDGSAQVGITAPLDQNLIVSTPEKSDAIEVGVKSALSRNIGLNASVFYQKFKGYLSRTPDVVDYASKRDGVIDGSSQFNFNADATSKGIEATLSSSISDDWNLETSLSYVHARFDNALIPCNDFNGSGVPNSAGVPRVPVGQQVSLCRSRDRLGDVPDVNLSFNSEYRFHLGSFEPFMRGLLTYRPAFYSSQSNYDYQSRTILNLFGGLRGPGAARWEVTVFAKNVLDQHRITHITLGNYQQATINGAPFDSGYRGVVTTQPREIGATARINF